jgi:hypothetical protein
MLKMKSERGVPVVGSGRTVLKCPGTGVRVGGSVELK